jgi:hypothetical protein
MGVKVVEENAYQFNPTLPPRHNVPITSMEI